MDRFLTEARIKSIDTVSMGNRRDLWNNAVAAAKAAQNSANSLQLRYQGDHYDGQIEAITTLMLSIA